MIHKIHILVSINYDFKFYSYTKLITGINMSKADLEKLIHEILKSQACVVECSQLDGEDYVLLHIKISETVMDSIYRQDILFKRHEQT
jgi:hypothetical protein